MDDEDRERYDSEPAALRESTPTPSEVDAAAPKSATTKKRKKKASAAPSEDAPVSKAKKKRTKAKSDAPQGGLKMKSRKSAAPPEPAPFRSEVTPAPVVLDARDTLRSMVEDQITIPPAAVPSTDDLDEHDERFFAEGEAASKRAAEVERTLHVAGRASTEADEEVFFEPPPVSRVSPDRQRRLANYVKAAVGFSAVVCFAALARVGFERLPNVVATPSLAAATKEVAVAPPAVTSPPLPVALSVPPPADAPAVPVAAIPAPPTELTVEPQLVMAGPGPVAAPAPAVAQPTAAPASEAPTKSALEEKKDAQRLLERGKSKDAVAAANRSVAIDPTDADAWLLLGAAQQDLGRSGDAHAAFASCARQAKKGEVGECRAMLTWNGPR